MDCPRCNLDMLNDKYEGEEVMYCGTCWGYWLQREQLDRIVENTGYKFSDSEKRTISRTLFEKGDVNRQGREEESVTCPVCERLMERKYYHPACMVNIDECGEHGIWLDTGEIKDLQVFIERRVNK